MACIGGILVWVAMNMVKPAEIKQVLAHNWFHVLLMCYTAIAVIVTDFLTGVLSALILYGLLFKFLDTPPVKESKDVVRSSSDTEQPEATLVEQRQPVSMT